MQLNNVFLIVEAVILICTYILVIGSILRRYKSETVKRKIVVIGYYYLIVMFLAVLFVVISTVTDPIIFSLYSDTIKFIPHEYLATKCVINIVYFIYSKDSPIVNKEEQKALFKELVEKIKGGV